MTSMRDRLKALEVENATLRARLVVYVRLDATFQSSLAEAVFAVAKNVSGFKPDEKMRILLAVAVLYGLIKPETGDA